MKLKGKRIETKEQQRDRIAKVLAAEVSDLQKSGIPNEVLGLKVYDSLIDARVRIETLQAEVKLLAEQVIKLRQVLDSDVKDMLQYGKTSKPC